MKCNINSLTILSIYNDLFKRKNYPYATRRVRRVHAHSLGTVPAAIMGTVPAAIGGQSLLLFAHSLGTSPRRYWGTVPATILLPRTASAQPRTAGAPTGRRGTVWGLSLRSGDCPHRSVGRDEGVASTGAGNRGVPAGSRQDSSPRPVPLRHHTPRARRSRAARFPSRPQCRWHGHRP